MSQPTQPPADLRAYVTILRRRKWSLLLVVGLCTGAALFASVRETPLYRSTARVLVKPLNPNQVLAGTSYSFLINMPTEQALATSPQVAKLAQTIAEKAGHIAGSAGTVNTSNPANTTFLDISYSSPTASGAQIWANAYANAYIQYRQQQAEQAYTRTQGGFTSRIGELQVQLSAAERAASHASGPRRELLQTKVTSLTSQINVLQSQLAQVPPPTTDATQLVAPAGRPTSPYTPNYKRNLGLALFLGVVLGVGVAFVRERLDDRMSGRDELEEELGAPVLAIVPRVAGWRKRGSIQLVSRDSPKSGPAESYRTIRTNLEFLTKTNDLRTLAVTSPSLGEGKTTTTANLAVALAQTGKKVVALSCDLRKPRLHRFFELPNDQGVTSILLHDARITEVAQRTEVNQLRVIASGPIPSNPAELLGSDAVAWMLSELRDYADYVVIDTAPVLAVSDALVLAPQADGVVVVVDSSTTTRAAVRAVRDQLEQVGANIVGGIFNNFDPADAKTYPGYYRYYYYGYGTHYGEKEGRGEGKHSDDSDVLS